MRLVQLYHFIISLTVSITQSVLFAIIINSGTSLKTKLFDRNPLIEISHIKTLDFMMNKAETQPVFNTVYLQNSLLTTFKVFIFNHNVRAFLQNNIEGSLQYMIL
jgi:hypothetical protein